MSLRRFPFWLTIFATCAVSFLSTFLVERFLVQRVAIFGSFVGLQRSFNDGVAFGIDLGMFQPMLISAALLVVCWLAIASARTVFMQVAYGLIVGGGFANVLDRLRDGTVTDMIQVGSFPIFNIADSAITIGVSLLLLDMIFLEKRRNR